MLASNLSLLLLNCFVSPSLGVAQQNLHTLFPHPVCVRVHPGRVNDQSRSPFALQVRKRDNREAAAKLNEDRTVTARLIVEGSGGGRRKSTPI